MADFADLQRVIRALAKVPSAVASDASESIDGLIRDQFAAGVDPYGEAWADLADATKAKGRSPPPLTDTGEMLGGIEVRPLQGAGISVTVPDPGVHHQYGTANMPQRAIYPNHGMPDTWQRAIADAADAAFDRASEGRRR